MKQALQTLVEARYGVRNNRLRLEFGTLFSPRPWLIPFLVKIDVLSTYHENRFEDLSVYTLTVGTQFVPITPPPADGLTLRPVPVIDGVAFESHVLSTTDDVSALKAFPLPDGFPPL